MVPYFNRNIPVVSSLELLRMASASDENSMCMWIRNNWQYNTYTCYFHTDFIISAAIFKSWKSYHTYFYKGSVFARSLWAQIEFHILNNVSFIFCIGPNVKISILFRLSQPTNDTLKLGNSQPKANGISDAAFKVPLPDSIDSQTNGKLLMDDVSTSFFLFLFFYPYCDRMQCTLH